MTPELRAKQRERMKDVPDWALIDEWLRRKNWGVQVGNSNTVVVEDCEPFGRTERFNIKIERVT